MVPVILTSAHYVTVQEGEGQARFEPVADQARVVKQIFSWIAQDRSSFSEVCHRLEKAGQLTATGKRTWSWQAVWHVLQNPAYQGQAAYGKTHMTSRGKEAACGQRVGARRNPGEAIGQWIRTQKTGYTSLFHP
ncbi:MAG: recombinase family protein [Acidobacteriia bacterium]|nr:recombinase family protein [Terriglobia bacterium]